MYIQYCADIPHDHRIENICNRDTVLKPLISGTPLVGVLSIWVSPLERYGTDGVKCGCLRKSTGISDSKYFRQPPQNGVDNSVQTHEVTPKYPLMRGVP